MKGIWGIFLWPQSSCLCVWILRGVWRRIFGSVHTSFSDVFPIQRRNIEGGRQCWEEDGRNVTLSTSLMAISVNSVHSLLSSITWEGFCRRCGAIKGWRYWIAGYSSSHNWVDIYEINMQYARGSWRSKANRFLHNNDEDDCVHLLNSITTISSA